MLVTVHYHNMQLSEAQSLEEKAPSPGMFLLPHSQHPETINIFLSLPSQLSNPGGEISVGVESNRQDRNNQAQKTFFLLMAT